MAMVASEELGVPLHKIQIEHADTGTTQFATPSGGSKTVPTEARRFVLLPWRLNGNYLNWRAKT
jgi:xanthine dehydrogenase YagR molybdenum-binding subunit